MSVSSANTALLGELVEDVVGHQVKVRSSSLHELYADLILKSTPKELKKWKDYAIRSSKSNQFARVNQFEVDATLHGLVEKFQVLNRDDLARGLNNSLKQLSRISSKWTPEVLALLLHLSDQPYKKTGAYTPQTRPRTPTELPLTWHQILAEDPVSDEDLWLEETYSPISSDSEDEVSSVPDLQASTPESRHSRYNSLDIGTFVVPPSKDILKDLTEAQFWNQTLSPGQDSLPNNQHSIAVSDLHAIRDAILMLRGLPTSLFCNDQNGIVRLNAQYSLIDVTHSLFASSMQQLATIGTKLSFIRSWTDNVQRDRSMQRFQFVIHSRLKELGNSLNELESSYANPTSQRVVSLAQIAETLGRFVRPVLQLEIVITELTRDTANPFIHLEMLYDLTCMHQAAGDDELYEYTARIFFDALAIYLRTIQQWIQHGELSSDDGSFFIVMNNDYPDDASTWHDQFALRKTSDDKIFAPKFCHPSAVRILNAGKSIIFLRKLGVKSPELENDCSDLTFESLEGHDIHNNLAPFASLFDQAFSEWINKRYSPASSILKEQLMKIYGLERSLFALREIYLSNNGSTFQAFADPIFEAIDRRASSWNDRFLLSERLQELHRDSRCVEINRLSVRSTSSKASTKSVKALSTIVAVYNVSNFYDAH
jgi:gamma-tubulin complex component 5